MTAFSVNNFGGVIPRLAPRLLPTNAGQSAQNAKLFSGSLTSWQRPAFINTPTKGGALKSMYRMYTTATDIWLAWTDDVDVVKGPIAGDTAFKLYYTGDSQGSGGPKKTNLALATASGTTYPGAYLEMGVPAPGTPMTIVGTGGTSTTSVARVYAYTYVTATASWAEEGPPSALGTGTGKTDAVWTLGGFSTGTGGFYALTNGAAVKRVYRALSDAAGNTNFQLAMDNVAMSVTTATDSTADADLSTICPTFTPGVAGSEWIGPPADLKGIVALPNGMMAGFSGNRICFSEPFRPHAWPLRYQLVSNFDIVGMGVYGNTLIVATKGFPYAVVGARPDSMSMSRIEELHPCVSKRSVVSFPFGVAWATSDGLALAGVGGVVNAIEPYMKRDDWRSRCFPDTIIAAMYLDTYFGFFNDGSNGLNFVFDKANAQGPLTFGNYNVQGGYRDPESSKFYIMQNGSIFQWDADPLNLSPFDWRSKTFVLPKPVNMGAIQVEADFSSLQLNSSALSSASSVDLSTNTRILGTGAADTAVLTPWSASTAYFTASGTAQIASIVKSTNGASMAICLVSGTSSSTQFAYPGTLGGTATDGTVVWKRIWEQQGVTKGSIRAATLQGHIQHTTSDPAYDGVAGNQWGFPLRGSLLVGPTFEDRNLLLQIYAITSQSTATGDSGTTLVHSQYLTSRDVQRLPAGFKSDTWEVRFSGNVPVRTFKIAETARELGQIQ